MLPCILVSAPTIYPMKQVRNRIILYVLNHKLLTQTNINKSVICLNDTFPLTIKSTPKSRICLCRHSHWHHKKTGWCRECERICLFYRRYCSSLERRTDELGQRMEVFHQEITLANWNSVIDWLATLLQGAPNIRWNLFVSKRPTSLK